MGVVPAGCVLGHEAVVRKRDENRGAQRPPVYRACTAAAALAEWVSGLRMNSVLARAAPLKELRQVLVTELLREAVHDHADSFRRQKLHFCSRSRHARHNTIL